MPNFVIDPQTTSFEDAKKEILDYLKSKPDFSIWRNFFDAATGTTVVDMVAGLAVFLKYNNIVSRRENYLGTAVNPSSVRSIVSSRGYNASRGKQPTLTITFIPTQTKLLERFDIVGVFKDFDLIVLNNTQIRNGVSVSIDVAVGSISEETIVSQSSELAIFQFKSNNVSDEMDLFIGDLQTSYGTRLLDLEDDRYVAITNGFGAVNVFFLNRENPEGAPQYATNSEIKIKYIATQEVNNLDVSSISFTESSEFTAAISSFQKNPESSESMKINGPLFYESQFVIRGRNDYEKILKSLNPRFIDVSSQDITPALVELSYLTEEFTKLTFVEDSRVSELLSNQYRSLGVPPPIFRQSRRVDLNLDINIKLLGIASENFELIVEDALKNINSKLRPTIDLQRIENFIETASSLEKVVRVTPSYSEFDINIKNRRLDHVVPTGGIQSNDVVYQLEDDFSAVSGDVEPVYSGAGFRSADIIDGDILWDVTRGERCDVPIWQPRTVYSENSVVTTTSFPRGLHLRFKRRASIRTSLADNEPNWPTTNKEIVIDSRVIWMAADLIGMRHTWRPNTNYNIGDLVIPTTPNGKMYQVVNYITEIFSHLPVWNPTPGEATLDVGGRTWRAYKLNNVTITPLWNEYFVVHPNIRVTT